VKFKIPKGTIITGTFPERTKVAGRSYVVTALAVDGGHDGYCVCHLWADFPGDGHSKHCYPPRSASICWAGAGGYWHYAALADVEPMDAEAWRVDDRIIWEKGTPMVGRVVGHGPHPQTGKPLVRIQLDANGSTFLTYPDHLRRERT
jgi:hypothetical protein